MTSKSVPEHLEYCNTDYQTQVIEMHISGMSQTEIANQLGKEPRRISEVVGKVHKRASRKGFAPDYNLNRQVAPGFTTKRVSTAYNMDNEIVLQWHIQEPDREKLEELIAQFVDGFKDEVTGIHAPADAPPSTDNDLMVSYIIGDHHLGMLAHHTETMGDDYDVKISQTLLENAIDRLVGSAPSGEVGVLVNLGDFMHVNDSTSSTPSSKNLLDSDGRYSKTIRAASNVIKRTVLRMLEKHNQVWIVNVRGNHDPDAALWLNEVMRLYFEEDPRVKVFDNASKFVWWQWGKNLIVTHHGDRIKMSNLHGSIVSNLRKQWGESDHTFVWTGHIHHKNQEEYSGALFESWNILAPADSYHAGAGYASSRSMTCVILHKLYGEQGRLKANIQELV
jgi:predicted phosphodiesterase